MKAFRGLTLNLVRSSVRNRTALLFTLGVAFIFMVIFGELFNSSGLSVSIDAVNNDHSVASTAYLRTLSGELPTGVTMTVVSASTAQTDLKNNNIGAELVIPSGFGATLDSNGVLVGAPAEIQILQPPGAEGTGQVAQQVISEDTYRYSGVVPAGTHPEVVVLPPITSSTNDITNIDFVLPGMIGYIILQSGINYVAIGLVELRVRKVLRRFRATPLRPAVILSAQICGAAITVLLQVVVLIAAGILLFGARSYGNWLLLCLPLLLGIVTFVGIGFLVTSAAKTSEAARGLALMLAFPMMFLSGIFFPITGFPVWLQNVVHVLPLTWLSDALHQVMNNGASLATITPDCLVLVAWSVVCFSIATWRFRWD